MQYRKDRYGNDISALGFGCMRFAHKNGRIDMEATEQQLMKAYEMGINYFDTAYIYPGSEACIGEIFEKNGIRDKIKIATKLPHYMGKSIEAYEKFFQEHLKRLRTDYIDYYLMHMLNDVDTWNKMVEKGIIPWLEEKKKSGAIRQLGFSYHGDSDKFIALLDAYDWDFCQIQYNYLDENSQAGRTGLEYAQKKGIPVIIMEPLRGGKLVQNLPASAKKAMEEHSVQHSPATWAFKWLWDQSGVTCILSGMNSMEMLLENIKTATETLPGELTDADKAMLKKVVDAINEKQKVGCTGCRYCMPCPQGVDIPGAFSAYNHYYTESKSKARHEYLQNTALKKNQTSASKCIGCGACERHCPQHIEIRAELKNATKVLENFEYKVAKKAISILKLY